MTIPQESSFDKISRIVGAIVIIYAAIFLFIRTLRFLKTFIPRDFSARYGKNSWVVITGASAGIGKGFSEELGRRGFNVVLISENQKDLVTAAESVRKINPNVQTKIIVADFSNCALPGFFDPIMKELEGLDISMLINNVGIAVGGPFHELTEQEIRNISIINTLPEVILTRKLIPQFLERKPRSAIVFLASIMSTKPFPYFTMYSATKVFSDFMARALAEEYPQLDIVSLRPVYVSTAMTFNRELSYKTITPANCALGLFKKLGHETSTAGHWRHCFFTFATLNLCPDWLFKFISKAACEPVGISFLQEKREIAAKLAKKE